MRRLAVHCLLLTVAWLNLSLYALGANAQITASNADPMQSSDEITRLLASRDIDAAAAAAKSAMLEQISLDQLKNTFGAVNNLGESYYHEIVYSRDYGRTGKDVIYKIAFESNILYVRYIFHVGREGKWHLANLTFNTESELPFPRDWQHIYP
jgi:hypothetical protein